MTTYELTSERVKGSVRLSYEEGLLKTVEIDFKDRLTDDQFGYFIGHLPYEQNCIDNLLNIGLRITETLRDNEKVALFCRLYERYIGIKYKVSAADSGKIKKIKLTEDICQHYMASSNFLFKGRQSIGNMVKYWNELLRDYANGGKAGNDFPNRYDREFEKTLDTTKTIRYYAHLRSLGLKPKKDSMQNIIGWV